jgi:hypothetical protein
MLAHSAVLDFEGANEREGPRRDAQMRLRPEIGHWSRPSTRLAMLGPNCVAGGWAAACPGTFLQAGGLNDRLRATTEGVNGVPFRQTGEERHYVGGR